MATKNIKELPLIVIVGPTASGKSDLAISIAKLFNGEIICADSRTVYIGMDIATAKPTIQDQQIVPHWGLDLVMPNQRFTAADFKKYADDKITEIRNRGHIPMLVGGTGLYVDAVLFGYEFKGEVNKKLRSELQRMSLEELYDYCKKHHINLPENYKNKRYVVRSIESSSAPKPINRLPVYKNIIVGITTDKNTLRERIAHRIEQQLENGVVEEAIKLGKEYGWKSEAMKSNLYPLVHDLIDNRITLTDFRKHSERVDWRLAKRQLTWLRRNKLIHWGTSKALNTYLTDLLATAE